MIDPLGSRVETLIRTVAQDVVMPRYQKLAGHEIVEKAANDFVTVADHESEIRLSEGLARLLPEAGIVGEEACAANPSLLDQLGSGLNWIIDPIDGTGNFAAGRPWFGIMVALSDGTEILESWIFDPLFDRMCRAKAKKGAFINGETVTARSSGESLPIAAFGLRYMTPEQRQDIVARSQSRMHHAEIPNCAAEQYPRLVLGQNDIAVYERTLPWDHAAGMLFLTEAGGRGARKDGAPYRIGDQARGLLCASSPALWDFAARALFA